MLGFKTDKKLAIFLTGVILLALGYAIVASSWSRSPEEIASVTSIDLSTPVTLSEPEPTVPMDPQTGEPEELIKNVIASLEWEEFSGNRIVIKGVVSTLDK